MHSILLIGDSTIAPYTHALQAEGFEVKHLLPGAEPPTTPPDAIVLDVSAPGEDPLARRYLDEAPGGESPPLIALLPPDRLETLDPATSPDDFLLAGATAA